MKIFLENLKLLADIGFMKLEHIFKNERMDKFKLLNSIITI